MKPLAFAVVLLCTTLAQAAPDGMALATQNHCLSCHQVDHKVVGPAYKDVAAKYRGDKTARAKLMAKVKAGGSGNWGVMAMPPQPVKDADLGVIIDWVLAQK